MAIQLTTPLTDDQIDGLKAGDSVEITGYIYTARDAAHKRLVDALDRGEELPIDVENAIIYYVGPAPAPEGKAIGSAGPTTAYRMDPYAPRLLDIGLKGMIAKGKRSDEVKESIVKNHAVYFTAIGGAAAVIAKSVKEAEIVTYEDLGAEAIRKLYVEKFPATVCVDSTGTDLYQTGRKEYLDWKEENEK